MDRVTNKSVWDFSALPLVSIVTPCLNRKALIQDAIESVLNQDYPHIEHVIVDGGSTDGTIEILKNYPHLKWISEPDEGMYDALNKAIRLSKGEIVGHLNSDDLYEKDIVTRIVECFINNPKLDMVHGGAVVFETDSKGKKRVVARYADSSLTIHNITIGIPVTNARFFHRRVYQIVGLYDPQYKIASDRDFLLRASLIGIKGKSINQVIYHYRKHDASLTISGSMQQATLLGDEYFAIAEHYLCSAPSPELQRCLTLWMDQTTSDMVIFGLLKWERRHVVHFVRQGWSHNKLWPLKLIGFAFSRLWNSLNRRFPFLFKKA